MTNEPAGRVALRASSSFFYRRFRYRRFRSTGCVARSVAQALCNQSPNYSAAFTLLSRSPADECISAGLKGESFLNLCSDTAHASFVLTVKSGCPTTNGPPSIFRPAARFLDMKSQHRHSRAIADVPVALASGSRPQRVAPLHVRTSGPPVTCLWCKSIVKCRWMKTIHTRRAVLPRACLPRERRACKLAASTQACRSCATGSGLPPKVILTCV